MRTGCWNIIAKIVLINESSIAHILCRGWSGCYRGIFMVDTLLNHNSDNNIISNKQRIHFNCTGQGKGCQEASITIIGVNNFELDCDSRDTRDACYKLALTVTSLDDIPSGTLTLRCQGKFSCDGAVINGLTLKNIDIDCISGDYRCHRLQVNFCCIFLFNRTLNQPLHL